ncbi:expressed unknown protein [Seminavis robusta]|uniref:Uncharacterized protein n=1 Tax=Seminavis robusta TaxID=568900 RepID=A0A9N8F5U1_9STRA|nr:expressed unknown protein [Seminavis robusta]|eukprot:Sro3620_g349780.1 n/a (242) ;mRNA; f:4177-4902
MSEQQEHLGSVNEISGSSSPELDCVKLAKTIEEHPELAYERNYSLHGFDVIPLYELVAKGANLQTVVTVYDLAPDAIESAYHEHPTSITRPRTRKIQPGLEMLSKETSRPSVLLFLIEKHPDLVASLEVYVAGRIIRNLLCNVTHLNQEELPNLEILLQKLLDSIPKCCRFSHLHQICLLEGFSDAIIQTFAEKTLHGLHHFHMHEPIVSEGYLKALRLKLPSSAHLAFGSWVRYGTLFPI